MKLRRCFPLLSCYFLFLSLAFTPAAGASPSAIQPPVLKWQQGGCYGSWCETGWYASPAVADLDEDGSPEVIGAAYSIFILNGASGSPKYPAIDPPGGRAWPGVVVADLEPDGDLEIVTAHGEGWLHVFNHLGASVWSRQPTPGRELRSLAAFDLDGNGDLEILAASTQGDRQWWVYEHNGDLRPGQWPQHHAGSEGYSWGCYNQNLSAGDLDGDGRSEIFGPNDTHYLAMFEDDGAQTLASPIYGLDDEETRKVWSQVGVHVDHAVDLRGWAHCGQEHRPNFAHSAPIMADLNTDGWLEAVVIGNVYNCGTDPYSSLYEMPFIFNADRTRWSAGAYDWTVLPSPDARAAPLSEDYNVIESNQPNPAAADLDGDGKLEILFPSYDGRLHAYWLDKTVRGSWPYAVNQPQEGFYRFASEPVVADLDDNGQAEVLFASWVQKGTRRTGKLHILDYLGRPIHTVDLPPAFGSPDWNGALAAPTLADIDGDPDLEIVLNTAHSGLLAYDLLGTANARVLWGTGRGSHLRSGSPARGILAASELRAGVSRAAPGETFTFTIVLRNPGPVLDNVSLNDALPVGLIYAGGLTATSGSYGYANNTVAWTGPVRTSQTVTISFDVTVSNALSSPTLLTNSAVIDDGSGRITTRSALIYINPLGLFLPLLR
jgi:uncharacterized repeat protein (TIGR01451 family)